MKVPQLDLRAQFDSIRDEVMEAVSEVFESQYFILGPNVQNFEKEAAEYLGAADCVGVSSGSDALRIALAVHDVGPGDEVLLPSFTFFATAGAVVHLGAKPVFVDVDEDYLMDLGDAWRRRSSKAKAVIPVHLYGLQAPMESLNAWAKDLGMAVIEDAAQSFGARRAEGASGTLGDAGAVSFFPSKNLGGAGDGGLIAFRDPEKAARARSYRMHGESRRYHHEEVGVNGRLDALQAAVLRVKMRHLDDWNLGRRKVAANYEARFAASKVAEFVIRPNLPEGGEHVFHQYTLRTPRRDELIAHLQEREIGCGVYYPVPLHKQNCFADLPGLPASLPVCERLAEEVLSLPIYPELSEDQQSFVVDSIAEFYA
jgi:dTDP-4-amino-4,6-dideoxygalactose transaminase